MHQINYFTLAAISEYLQNNWANSTIFEVFTQQKDEVIIGILKGDQEMHLRVSCDKVTSYIIPVTGYKRAKSNTVDLFPELIDQTIHYFAIHPSDRLILLKTNKKYSVVFKMHGNKSNMLLLKDKEVSSIFVTNLEKDMDFEWPTTERMPWKDFVKSVNEVKDYEFLDKATRKYIKQIPENEAIEWIKQLANPSFYVQTAEGKFMLYEEEPSVKHEKVEDALMHFLRLHYSLSSFEKLQSSLNQLLNKKVVFFENKVNSFYTSLDAIANSRNYEEFGHLILSNLPQIQPKSTEIIVLDFYNENQELKIKLSAELNPQENANYYFKKQKQRKQEIVYIEKMLLENEEHLKFYQEKLNKFNQLSTYKEYLSFQKNEMEMTRDLKPKKESPFKVFIFENYNIYVGKNAKNNDELSFNFAKGEDYWLHAKDVAGSHVVIHCGDRKKPANSVIEYAASLAAFHSKNRYQQWVAVTYTPRKYVRKGKGMAPGHVFVEREEVVFVNPSKN